MSKSSVTPLQSVPIIDAHHHLWAFGQHRYPWLESDEPSIISDRRSLRRPYLAADYRRDAATLDVVGTVHLDGGFDPDDPVGETRMVQSIAERDGFPDAIVAQVALDRPDAARLIRAHLAASPLVRGIRHIVAWHPDPVLSYVDRPDRLRDPDWLQGFGLLGPLGLSFDLQVYPSQMADAAALARANPETSIILDQAGMPLFRSDGDRRTWADGLARLAQEPNVSIKLSGFGMCRHPISVDAIRPLVQHALRVFGPERAMFASNFPVDGLFSSLAGLYAAYDGSVADRPEPDRRMLFAGTAARTYRLGGDPNSATER